MSVPKRRKHALIKHRRAFACLLALACLTTIHPVVAEDVEFEFAVGIGATETDRGYSLAVDASGNVYTTGFFQGTVDFDPGSGNTNLTSAGDVQDTFICKLDSMGHLLWAKAIDGAWSLGIAVDFVGNVYTTGAFSGTADFDPGPGTTNLASLDNESMFVLKLDSDGTFVWAKAMSGTGGVTGWAVALDASGNVYTTGLNSGTTDFDPGPDTFNLSFVDGRVVVCKLDSDGDFVWAKAMGGSQTYSYSIAVDAAGNAYTTGQFTGTADFDPGPGTFNLISADYVLKGVPQPTQDIFVSKLDADGNFVWAQSMGAAAIDFFGGDKGQDIAVDDSGNVFTAGRFIDTVDFDPGPGTFELTSAGGPTAPDFFLQKLDSSGDFLWAKALGLITFFDTGLDITVDRAGSVYTTGWFGGTVDFNPAPDTANLTGAGAEDVFIQKLDLDGRFVWAKSLGGTGSDIPQDIEVDSEGSVYTTGWFNGTADFDPGPDITNLTSNGGPDIFISKLAPVFGTGGVITTNLPPGFVEAESTWVLTAPAGTSHTWTWPGQGKGSVTNVVATGDRLMVMNIGELNLGTYSVVYDDGAAVKATLISEITLDSLIAPGSLPNAHAPALILLILTLIAAASATLTRRQSTKRNKHLY